MSPRHGEVWIVDMGIAASGRIEGNYDDPTTQIDALGQAKSFAYDPNTRIMTQVTDQNKTAGGQSVQ